MSRTRAAEGVLELLRPACPSDGWQRSAIYLDARSNLNLAGLSFSRLSRQRQLRFVPAAGQSPSITDTGLAGKLAVAWLKLGG